MRKFAMISTALLGLAFFSPSQAQPAQSAPQPGLPPGAAIGATNAPQPPATGALRTTTTGVQPTPAAPYAGTTSAPPPPPRRRVIRHRRHRARTVHTAPAAAPAAPAAQ